MGIKKAILLFFLLLLVFSCTRKSSNTKAVPATEAIIEYLSGDVLVNNKRAETDDKIANKSTIATGDDGICEIIFDNKNIIKVSSNTLFELDFSGVHKSVNLKQGTLINVLKKLATLTDDADFTIETANAVLGVRGTSFFVKADEDSTYVCVCNGTVTVMDEKKNNPEEISAKHHVARLFTKTDQGTVMIPAAMLYHTDEDIEKVAEKIGYDIDWESIE